MGTSKQLLLILVLAITHAQIPTSNDNVKISNFLNATKQDKVIIVNESGYLYKQKQISGIIENIGFLATNKMAVTNKQMALEGKNIIICDGDSRTDGYTGGTSPWRYSEHLDLGTNYIVYNTATGGVTFTDNEIEGVRWITKDAYNVVTPLKSETSMNNIVVIWAGFNDVAVRDKSTRETFESLKIYCLARKSEEFKVIVVTEPSTSSIVGEGRRLILNSLVRNSVYEYADRLVDLEQNEFIGPQGTASNTKFFFDGVHMTEEGYGLVGAIVRSEILNLINLDAVEFESKNKIQLVPHPSNDCIQVLGLTERKNYIIINIFGAEVSKGEVLDNEIINIHNLANGLYFLKFENGKAIKFLKE